MSWLEFCLIAMVVTRSHGCIACSKDAMNFLEDFKGRYLENKLHAHPDLKRQLRKSIDSAIEGLALYPIDPKIYMAIIDEFTLGKLADHLKRALRRIMESDFEVQRILSEVTWMFQGLKTTFGKIMPAVTQIHCGNECGQMVNMFIGCHTCKTNYYTCTKDYWCGVRKVNVETDEDLILDCGLWWHKRSHGDKKYSFYRMVGGKEQLMTTVLDSFLVKKEANVNDTGKYRCRMLGAQGYTSSILDFQVTVLPANGRTTWFHKPHATLEGPLTLGVSSRAPPPQADWTAWIVVGSTGGLLTFIIGAFICFYRHKNKKEEEDEEDEHETESESSEVVET